MQSKLLNKDELAWSPVVANNSMNRERNAFGINSYEKDIHLNPVDFLLNLKEQKNVRWLDLCCGKGNALIQAAQFLEEKKLSNKYELEGIDLVDFFTHAPGFSNLILSVQNLENWTPEKEYDLITIVHGLHYVGDKIGLVLKAIEALKTNGHFIGNLDLSNILVQNIKQRKRATMKFFNENNIEINLRKKLIYSTGKKTIKSKFAYLGADDKAGPNYTGQEVVNSYYRFTGSEK
ncbi:MAG: methyltransferase domain-containing protein [Bacteroidota bacterium]